MLSHFGTSLIYLIHGTVCRAIILPLSPPSCFQEDKSRMNSQDGVNSISTLFYFKLWCPLNPKNPCDAIIITPHVPALCCQEEKYGINSQRRDISNFVDVTISQDKILSPDDCIYLFICMYVCMYVCM
ncbi:hypothetical protein KUF71_016846, partial [Frankliniella fusca]